LPAGRLDALLANSVWPAPWPRSQVRRAAPWRPGRA